MTAATATITVPPAPVRPTHRVCCGGCGWVGYRLRPAGRGCPRCGAGPSGLWPVWLAGCAPRRGRCAYLAHLWPPYRHAAHYLGFTANLPRRWAAHVRSGYDPARRRALGDGARLLAAARHAGCRVELVRVWYGDQARQLEQRLKQRRKPGSLRAGAAGSLKPLCPVCCGTAAYRRYPVPPQAALPPASAPSPAPPAAEAAVWDADREWDLTFPHLAYGPMPSAFERGADANPDRCDDGRAPAPQTSPALAAATLLEVR